VISISKSHDSNGERACEHRAAATHDAVIIEPSALGDYGLDTPRRKITITLDKDELISFLSDKVAKWWLPDDVQFVEAIPHTATGKILKTRLREDFKDYKLPTT